MNIHSPSKFYIKESDYKINIFNSSPIYMICFDIDGKSYPIGEGFSSEIKAQEVCNWLNNTDEELQDIYAFLEGSSK